MVVETRFALDCWRRKTDLEKRFRKARIAEGKVRFVFLCLPVPSISLIVTTNSALHQTHKHTSSHVTY